MSVTVIIPTPLRSQTGNQETVEVEGKIVKEILTNLLKKHPKLKKYLYSENGELRNFVNVYVKDENIRHLEGEDTKIENGETITIVPSVAGG